MQASELPVRHVGRAVRSKSCLKLLIFLSRNRPQKASGDDILKLAATRFPFRGSIRFQPPGWTGEAGGPRFADSLEKGEEQTRDQRGAKKERLCDRQQAPEISGASGEIRTHGLLLRRQTLYPTELRTHAEHSTKEFPAPLSTCARKRLKGAAQSCRNRDFPLPRVLLS